MALRSERRFISYAKVESGMIIDFDYTKADGSRNRYMVLVIDPSRLNHQAKERQLHGYIVSEFSDIELLKFLARFQTSINLSQDSRRDPVVEGLDTVDAYDKFKLMDSDYKDRRLYRTFIVSKIDRPRQILIGLPD